MGLTSAPEGAGDEALVAAVRAGDDAAFEELYRRYRPRIGAFIYGFVRDEGRSEDVAQEVFLSALRRMRETSSPIAFRPWIYEIARNAAIDVYRRASRTEEVSINADNGLPPADRRRLVGSEAPENALRDKESIEHLRGALDELSEAHHRILVLRELEGRSYREIGDRMDLTAPAVESTLFRARRRLEQEYAELDTGRRCVSMRSIIARLAEGVELPRERRKLERHALRCTTCRRRARELGVEPMRRGVVSRAAALLPLPAILRRRSDGGSWASLGAPAVEGGGVLVGKAGALLAAAVLVGGGGATLGGYGPLAPQTLERQATSPAKTPSTAPVSAPDRAPARGGALEGDRTAGQAGPAPPRRSPGPAASGPVGGAAPPNAPAAHPEAPAARPTLDQELPELPPVETPPVETPPVERLVEPLPVEAAQVESPSGETSDPSEPETTTIGQEAAGELHLHSAPAEPLGEVS